MKKLLIATAALSAIATPALAANGNNNSATAVVRATVPLVCEVTAADGSTSIAVTGETSIGSASVLCNDVDGFIATVSSANAGVMAATQANNSSTIPYTLNIQGVASGVSLATDQSFPGPAYLTTASFPISVVTNGTNGPAYAGNYRDVITFSIQNN